MVEFEAELWLWDARRDDSRTFVTLPEQASEEIRELTEGSRRGFGSVRVHATAGKTRWKTSIFPDSKSGCYVLPVKRAVREAEGLDAGDSAGFTIRLMD